MRYKNFNKYHNHKTIVDGRCFDSKKEAKRWGVLKFLEEQGNISDLQRQVKFVLIPAQREANTTGKRGGIIKGKVIEREVSYIADFTYIKDGELIVEDTKGVRTPEYVIKRKLMLWIKGIRITEV